jgi:hypothetical protein
MLNPYEQERGAGRGELLMVRIQGQALGRQLQHAVFCLAKPRAHEEEEH